jgi:hypothetical protein
MNPYKEAWMMNCNIIYDNMKPAIKDSTQNDIPDNIKLASAVTKTARAAAIAVAISQVDGPLPVADVLAAVYLSTSAALTWYDYFS